MKGMIFCMAINKATILSADEITKFYENMWPDYRYQAMVTDHVVLNGGIYDKSSSNPSKRFGSYWTKSANPDGDIITVSIDGCINSCAQAPTMESQNYGTQKNVFDSTIGIRPAFHYNFPRDIQELIPNSKERYPDFLETTYGHYAQNVASRHMQETLNQAMIYDELRIIQNGFHTFFHDNLKTFDVYEYGGELYILEEVYAPEKDPNSLPCGTFYLNRELYKRMIQGSVVLSNGVSYNNGDLVWVKIEPVKFLINLKRKMILAEKILSTGCSFLEKTSNLTEYNGNNYEKSKLNLFLTDYFDQNLLQINNYIRTDEFLLDTNYSSHEAGTYQITRENTSTMCAEKDPVLRMTDEKFFELIGEKSTGEFESIMKLMKNYRQS